MENSLLTIDELIDKMESKGITFIKYSKEDAKKFIDSSNNYFRVTAYRKNYDKYPVGENKGKYRHLDFIYLKELSTIDMHLRYLILKMCLDIEHCLKLDLLHKAERINDDGFKTLNSFLQDNSNEYIKKDIYYKRNSNYCSDLIKSCFVFDNDKKTISDYSKCRLWALLEVITFGQFVKLYNFFHDFNNLENKYKSNINVVKSLRNACAHNNCIISNLNQDRFCRPAANISQFVSTIKDIGNGFRHTQLSIRTIYEITTLIYVYNMFVSEKIKEHRFNELKTLVNERMIYHKDFFVQQQKIYSSYKFIKKVVDSV